MVRCKGFGSRSMIPYNMEHLDIIAGAGSQTAAVVAHYDRIVRGGQHMQECVNAHIGLEMIVLMIAVLRFRGGRLVHAVSRR